MAIREIIKVPNPILKKVSKPVDQVDDEIRGILDDMLDTMYDAPGIGLAAIQIGIPLRMLVIDISSVAEKENNEKNPQFFINPEIISPSNNLSSFEEGCLSVPGIWEEIERPDECIVKFLNRNGEKEEKIVKDLDDIIEFVDQLDDVDTSNIEPLTNPLEKTAKTRSDKVTAKNLKDKLLEIAPSSNEDYFLVPRVVE